MMLAGYELERSGLALAVTCIVKYIIKGLIQAY
jgi:hypothetical protein